MIKHVSPNPGRGKVFAFLNYVKDSFFRHDGVRTSAFLSFQTLFAVVPVITVTFAVLSLIPDLRRLDSTIRDMLFRHVLPDTGTFIEQYLQSFAEQAANLTTLGVLMLFVTCMAMLRRIESAFNKIWHVREPRTGVNGFLLYWAILSIGPLLMGLAFAASSYVASQQLLAQWLPWLAVDQWLWNVVPVASTVLVFSLAYIAIPNTRVPWLHGVTGGVVAALLFEIARHAMAYGIRLFPGYQFIYGAFAAVPIFLLWIYVSWGIVLLGAEIVQSMSYFRHQGRNASAALPDVLLIVWGVYQRQRCGEIAREADLLASLQWHDMTRWEDYTQLLETRGWLVRQEDGWVLLRDLHLASLRDLARSIDPAPLLDESPAQVPWQPAFNARMHRAAAAWDEAMDIPVAHLFEAVNPSRR